MATIERSKAFLALKPFYWGQSTKSNQLTKPDYFLILLYWYSTSFIINLPPLFLRESHVKILCSCLWLDQNSISMFWCLFPLNAFQSFLCMIVENGHEIAHLCNFLSKGTYLQVFISTRTYRGKHKGHLMEKNTFESLNQNLKWERKLCKRWHAHRPMVRININVANYLLYFSYFIEKIHPEAGGHTIEP